MYEFKQCPCETCSYCYMCKINWRSVTTDIWEQKYYRIRNGTANSLDQTYWSTCRKRQPQKWITLGSCVHHPDYCMKSNQTITVCSLISCSVCIGNNIVNKAQYVIYFMMTWFQIIYVAKQNQQSFANVVANTWEVPVSVLHNTILHRNAKYL